MASRMKVLMLGGIAVAAGTVAYLKRDRVAGLLPSRTQEPAAPPPPPAPSNYDAPGPPANTATPVPAPEPATRGPLGTVDEQAEADAAAAEAAAIGGTPTEYAGSEPGVPATEAERPLAEGGEGESEGLEQAESDLADRALQRDAGGDPARERLDEVIEQASDPSSGETPEALRPATDPPPEGSR
jgi:hypothetical protein